MSKPELGTKRLCAHCGAKFYDLHHSPITCRKCGRVFEPVEVSSRFRAEAAREPVREVEPVRTEIPEAEFVPLVDADAVAEGAQGLGDEAEEVVEPNDDEVLDETASIDESEREDGNLDEINGDDIDIEEENNDEEGH